jgi:VanZ family protein
MHLLRKAAHFTEFTALGMGFAWLFGMLSQRRVFAMTLPLLCGSCAAAIDETIQIFSPDRGPSIKDVGLDTAGVITGIVLVMILHALIARFKGRNR